MPDINCGECARYRTPECRPDKCLPEHKSFLDPYKDPSRFCEKCHARLNRPRTDRVSPEFRKIELECPNCGLVGYIERQFIRKRK